MMFCGPARDTVLTNRQTEKLNFDTNYITITIVALWISSNPEKVIYTNECTKGKVVLNYFIDKNSSAFKFDNN
jgi:hypothetical protein